MAKFAECFICGRVLTKAEAEESCACSECIERYKKLAPTEIRVPKTGSNVKPAPRPDVKLDIKLSDSYMHTHMDEALYTDTQKKLIDVLDGMKSLLLYKNRKYGDSAINPKKVF